MIGGPLNQYDDTIATKLVYKDIVRYFDLANSIHYQHIPVHGVRHSM
jgi:hypothetical protein